LKAERKRRNMSKRQRPELPLIRVTPEFKEFLQYQRLGRKRKSVLEVMHDIIEEFDNEQQKENKNKGPIL